MSKTYLSKKYRIKRNRQFLDEYLDGKPCCKCKQPASHFVVRDPAKRRISELAYNAVSTARLAKEFPFCDLYCKKCVHGVRFRRTTRKPGKAQNNRTQLRSHVRAIKEAGNCALCPENQAVALDFHHVNPDEKEMSISELVKSGSRKRIDAEILKCVILCANCHRKLHAGLLEIPD